ncbi:hypothetical protein PFL603g_05169 [Pseudomonas fluorescens]|uniref:Uncharacterized protein n=1 Tax=Pseudomonas fluorescens TaxID=294 RepID=A0A109KJR1_PSEFL|nr:hypothetical protein PFL603g_05169 [Pseudomonas fluorescens]
MWELACLRWHHPGVTDRPRCCHRRQASSHRGLFQAWRSSFFRNTVISFSACLSPWANAASCLEVRYIQGGVRDKHGTLGDNRGQAARTIAKRLQPMQRAPGSPRQTESTSTNFQPGSKARPGHSLCNVEPQAPSSEAELLLCTVWSSPGQPSQPPSLPYARLDIAAMTIWIQHSLAQRSSVGGR